MQSAETVLGVLRERGRRGLPLEELYRQMFNPQLYLLAYGRIYANKGAMTPGVTQETVDGMSLGKIGRIIEAMRHERYRFRPVRRVMISKKGGKLRPLGLPTWSDKLVGEVVRLLLEAYYEPQFSDRSHGFRPGRGCHTALREVANTWTGTAWFIEGDIADCFGSLDHEILISILAEKIHDNRFLRLVRNMLTAGYLEDWRWGATLSGAPQGGVASPILSNLYLHKLDVFVEKVLIPEYTRGGRRARNPAYLEVANLLATARRRGDRAEARTLLKRMRTLPSSDPDDPEYRRLRYCRYADDHLLGFTGPKAEAEEIKQRLAAFLRDELKLELSHEKTLITHARSSAARFLGYDITIQHDSRRIVRGRRSANAAIGLRVPKDVIKAKCSRYLASGKPAHRGALIHNDDHPIIATFGAEYRGIVQYYLLAGDVHRLHRLEWVMKTSMLKTLAGKHHSTVSKMAARHKAKIETPHGLRTCFEARIERDGRQPLVARFGGIPLKRQKTAVISDRRPLQVSYPHKELISRLLANTCEICKQTDNIQVHHVRKLADLARTGDAQPDWMQLMARRRRKSLVVCGSCYDRIQGWQSA
ncbi:reverse transcriptase domain-containing protein [Micromonospora sp. WMMA1363]|uniref:reverse transcriptase/maturase family protein n=1 Tax=Micromonospora sp. WMMA1363 TaxID=3053985 RepID=UPI00259C6B2C|nr:reverse transcriptase/maturase family protein [Micromonospora sp. WMMA1363]MDM4719169.1 reverse transcriptase domain-containing protein [Micromonospora sp. WMMA1363]MDM4719673.1 reverse transcriptase domain-containing protein [Micromonospora sp. WMMA1363]MDM4721434.1 reverse transcriptase domain-containing protein [Micromonospora sp. WMMA1363]MDM4723202.1 reverse transcriptase domain-containing protein [Micromonospora sp. WMMA1363]MDM4723459.1 reverse transcriptase domain-containing protein